MGNNAKHAQERVETPASGMEFARMDSTALVSAHARKVLQAQPVRPVLTACMEHIVIKNANVVMVNAVKDLMGTALVNVNLDGGASRVMQKPLTVCVVTFAIQVLIASRQWAMPTANVRLASKATAPSAKLWMPAKQTMEGVQPTRTAKRLSQVKDSVSASPGTRAMDSYVSELTPAWRTMEAATSMLNALKLGQTRPCAIAYLTMKVMGRPVNQ